MACVDLAAHRTWIRRDGTIVFGPVVMLPGSSVSPTPRGSYRVQWKAKTHVSGEFGDDMPFAVFFAAGGIAFHEGSLTRSSHGCIHLGAKAAAGYFAQLRVGDSVAVF